MGKKLILNLINENSQNVGNDLFYSFGGYNEFHQHLMIAYKK